MVELLIVMGLICSGGQEEIRQVREQNQKEDLFLNLKLPHPPDYGVKQFKNICSFSDVD